MKGAVDVVIGSTHSRLFGGIQLKSFFQLPFEGQVLYDRGGPEGVAFILDTKLQAARTALRSGRSVNSTAGPHRSLRARARSCTMCSPVAPFHLAPQRFIRTSNKLLQVASALPLPSGRPSRRALA